MYGENANADSLLCQFVVPEISKSHQIILRKVTFETFDILIATLSTHSNMMKSANETAHKAIGPILWESLVAWIAMSTFVQEMTDTSIIFNLFIFVMIGIITLLFEYRGLMYSNPDALKFASLWTIVGSLVPIGAVLFWAIQMGIERAIACELLAVIVPYPALLTLGVWGQITLCNLAQEAGSRGWRTAIGRSVIGVFLEILGVLFAILIITGLHSIIVLLMGLLCICWIVEFLGDHEKFTRITSGYFILSGVLAIGSGLFLLSPTWALGYGAALYLLAVRILSGINLYTLSQTPED